MIEYIYEGEGRRTEGKKGGSTEEKGITYSLSFEDLTEKYSLGG